MFWTTISSCAAPSGFALTPRAEEIAPRVTAILNAARVIYRPAPFEPSKVRRVLHVAGCDVHSILFAPGLMNRIRKEAPGIELSIENYTRDVFKRLEDGSVDLIFFQCGDALAARSGLDRNR
jgi:DNA-binding transcriptional LysR family regulator